MNDDNPRMRELIENSSLGTPEAKRLRESVPVEVGREIVRRAEEKRTGSDTCDAEFGFFLHVVTICGRPAGHRGDHHPIALACDAESSPLRADLAPRSGAAHPGPVSRDGGTGSGCASNP